MSSQSWQTCLSGEGMNVNNLDWSSCSAPCGRAVPHSKTQLRVITIAHIERLDQPDCLMIDRGEVCANDRLG